eukprot:6491058-Amphidinium_carterae.5
MASRNSAHVRTDIEMSVSRVRHTQFKKRGRNSQPCNQGSRHPFSNWTPSGSPQCHAEGTALSVLAMKSMTDMSQNPVMQDASLRLVCSHRVGKEEHDASLRPCFS